MIARKLPPSEFFKSWIVTVGSCSVAATDEEQADHILQVVEQARLKGYAECQAELRDALGIKECDGGCHGS